jgi:hypothetical protein
MLEKWKHYELIAEPYWLLKAAQFLYGKASKGGNIFPSEKE